jgi:membrane-associated phospholipid phosphatase
MKTSWSGIWRAAWRDRLMRVQYVVTLPALALVLFCLSRFLEYAEQRQGVVLPDPLLALFQPHDVTWLTFGLIYGALTVAIYSLLQNPARLLVAMHAYIVLVLFRIAVMFVTPLDHPQGMILLHDPFVEEFGPARVLTKDLFFSGHTATLFLLGLIVTHPKVKSILLFGTFLVGFCVLWQHVHYTIDVLTAVGFAYCAYRMVLLLHRRIGDAERISAGQGQPGPGESSVITKRGLIHWN